MSKDFQDTEKNQFLKRLPSDYGVSEHLIMTPSRICFHEAKMLSAWLEIKKRRDSQATVFGS